MYQQINNSYTNTPLNVVRRLSDNACIPFDPDNTDYQVFKTDLANGATLQDATGTAMTASDITTFLQGLK